MLDEDNKKKTPADIVKGMEARLERDLISWIFQQSRLPKHIDCWIAGEVDIDEEGE